MNPNPILDFGKLQGSRGEISKPSKNSQKSRIEIPRPPAKALFISLKEAKANS